MKSSNKKRSNGRHGHFSNGHRPSNVISRNTVLDSNGPIGHIRGTAQQLVEKYITVSKDARHQNDYILSELCSQQAEHYIRLVNQAIQYEMAEKEEALLNETSSAEQTETKEDEVPSCEEKTPEENDKEKSEETPKAERKPKRHRSFPKKKESIPVQEQPDLPVAETVSPVTEE